VGHADSDQQLAEAVRAYLSECPNAMDTAAGIAEWWLARQHVRVHVEAVTRVLNTLVKRGELEEIDGEEQRYRLKRD
jgi:hypothetical protein